MSYVIFISVIVILEGDRSSAHRPAHLQKAPGTKQIAAKKGTNSKTSVRAQAGLQHHNFVLLAIQNMLPSPERTTAVRPKDTPIQANEPTGLLGPPVCPFSPFVGGDSVPPLKETKPTNKRRIGYRLILTSNFWRTYPSHELRGMRPACSSVAAPRSCRPEAQRT